MPDSVNWKHHITQLACCYEPEVAAEPDGVMMKIIGPAFEAPENNNQKFEVGAVICTILLLAPVVLSQTIPASKSQLNSSFSFTIKPLYARKDSLDPKLATAEAEPQIVKVKKDGSGDFDFDTITKAIASVPPGNTKRVILSIGLGVYKEKISAPKPNGVMEGAQAAALRISGSMAAFYKCKFIGYRDTLCDDRGYHFFKDCYIYGTVDFIFGSGTSIYLNSELYVEGDSGLTVITAQARESALEKTGYIFVHCSITGMAYHGLEEHNGAIGDHVLDKLGDVLEIQEDATDDPGLNTSLAEQGVEDRPPSHGATSHDRPTNGTSHRTSHEPSGHNRPSHGPSGHNRPFDPLAIPQGPMTRARAKRFKETLLGFVRSHLGGLESIEDHLEGIKVDITKNIPIDSKLFTLLEIDEH
ncbi:Pectinesterase, catalytic [Corchorus capsularis]|uniref:Pectinesterase n=1 Tax=Corchorus capsularis TaxID=210143 RepID=A0A1R3GB28_COCAP|nr:Pectinesterase, catalytic [Corchorus capsularis]